MLIYKHFSKIPTQEWNCWIMPVRHLQFCHWNWKWKLLNYVWLLATPWTVVQYYIVHGILQARILEWVAFPFSRGSSQPRDWSQVSHTAGGFFTGWATLGLFHKVQLLSFLSNLLNISTFLLKIAVSSHPNMVVGVSMSTHFSINTLFRQVY